MLRRRIQEKARCLLRILDGCGRDEVRDRPVVRFDLPVPFLHFAFLPGEVFVAMTLLAGILDSELLIKCRPGDGNAMVGAGKEKTVADALMLKIRHMAGSAEVAR